jgi:cell division protein FtsQ
MLSILAACLLLGYIVVTAVFFKDAGSGEVCKNVVVKIENNNDKRFVTEADVLAALKQAKLDPTGKPMNSINTEKIESELLRNGMLEKVDAYKTLSGAIILDIREKTPILRVMGTGGDFYVDSKGSLMPLSRRYSVYVPVASGCVEKRLATTDLYKFALFLQENDFWKNQIEQIYVHPDQDVELIPRVGEHRIVLGTFDDFKEKLANLQLFYEQAIPKMGWDKYGTINLKFKNQIVCTKK